MPFVVRCEPSRMVAVLALLLSLIGSPMPGALPLEANLHRPTYIGWPHPGISLSARSGDRRTPTGRQGPLAGRSSALGACGRVPALWPGRSDRRSHAPTGRCSARCCGICGARPGTERSTASPRRRAAPPRARRSTSTNAAGLTPSLAQFLELVEFYVLGCPRGPEAKPEADLRAQGVAAVTRALELPAYHVVAARELIGRMQPPVKGEPMIRLTRDRPRRHRGRGPRTGGRGLPAAPRRRARRTASAIDDQGVEEVLFRVGSSFIQLLGALRPDTPVGRSLARRGPGVHHVAYRVDDIEDALEHLREEGARLVDDAPRRGLTRTP